MLEQQYEIINYKTLVMMSGTASGIRNQTITKKSTLSSHQLDYFGIV